MFDGAAYQREYWKTHPEHREDDAKRKRNNMRLHAVWLFEYLSSHPCVVCGEPDPVVLEFDHLTSDGANRDVSSMAQYSRKRVLKEVAKCEVTCANCHTRRTAQRANTPRWQLNKGA